MDSFVDIANLLVFLNKFKGYDDKQLSFLLGFDTKAKNRLSLRMNKVAENFKGKDYFSVLCKQENIQLKTLQLNENGKVKEAMSFPKFDYESVDKECWESSDIYKILSGYFIFCVFKDNYYLGSFLWRIPREDLYCEVKDVWQKTKEIIHSGNVVKETGDKTKLNFPAEAETKICHVRPHGRNALDSSKLPVKDARTGWECLPKQSFWLNHCYLNKIVEENRKLLLKSGNKKGEQGK